MNNNYAIVFPGQGSQAVGMGAEFYENFKIVKKLFLKADERLNYPISKLILEGPEEKLKLTENTQPAILTVSYSIFRVLKDEFNFEFSFTLPTSDKSYLSFLKYRLLKISSAISIEGASPGLKTL